MLRKFLNNRRRNIDGTYKLNDSGWAGIVVGLDDDHRKYHPVICGISTNERAEDYKAIVQAIELALMQLDPEYTTSTDIQYMCDGADAIRSGITDFFESVNIEVFLPMCWAHAKRKIQENVNTKLRTTDNNNNKMYREAVLSDIQKMHYIPCGERYLFEFCIQLFAKKWSEVEPLLLPYLNERWFTRTRFWSCAYSKAGQSTSSNGCERHNRTLKVFQLHKRWPVMTQV